MTTTGNLRSRFFRNSSALTLDVVQTTKEIACHTYLCHELQHSNVSGDLHGMFSRASGEILVVPLEASPSSDANVLQ